ncbi:phosphomannomutase [Thiovulum sp. ES]|nr:phosphomannomutase [Thiovulum sp. ES]
MKSIFREYDIRGIFQKELNNETLHWIGVHLGSEIKKIGDTVAVGFDARTHSEQIFQFLSNGLAENGLRILNMGLVPTPNNYFSNFVEIAGENPSASIMITGSHNPPEYNGLKITIDKKPFFGEDIYSLGEKVISALGKEFPNNSPKIVDFPAKESYIDFLVKEFSHLKGFQNVVYDCGNGAGGVVFSEVLEKLEIGNKGLFVEPDGTFPNHHPDPSEEENLTDLKNELENGDFEIGFAFDGDADRIAVLTKHGNIKGDILATIFAKQMKNPTVVGEVKCSQVMYDEIDLIGKAIMYKTGHSNLKVKMREVNADLGAEVSGHIFFKDRYFGFDDAIYTALRVLELLQNGINLHDEVEKLPKTISTDEIKIQTTEDKKFKIMKELKEKLKNPPENFPKILDIVDVDGVRCKLENGWALVRASNTTPVLVTRFEVVSNENDLNFYMESFRNLLRELGV